MVEEDYSDKISEVIAKILNKEVDEGWTRKAEMSPGTNDMDFEDVHPGYYLYLFDYEEQDKIIKFILEKLDANEIYGYKSVDEPWRKLSYKKIRELYSYYIVKFDTNKLGVFFFHPNQGKFWIDERIARFLALNV